MEVTQVGQPGSESHPVWGQSCPTSLWRENVGPGWRDRQNFKRNQKRRFYVKFPDKTFKYFLKTQFRPNKIHPLWQGGPVGHQVTNSVFVWGTSRPIFWPRQADGACGGQVNFIFSVLLLVGIFTERFGEGSDWQRLILLLDYQWFWNKLSMAWNWKSRAGGKSSVSLCPLSSQSSFVWHKELFLCALTHDFSILQAGC